MRIELLPSSFPETEIQYLVSFVVNDTVAIDAGSLGLLADLGRQQAIRHVFLTHEHLDHIASLPLFLDNVYSAGPECVELLAAADVLEFLHGDIFNGRVWPDFFRLSSPDRPFLRTTVLEPMVSVERAGLVIAGTNPAGSLVEVVELADHPWFVAVQYHPEFKSKPTAAHPLFAGLVAAAVERHAGSAWVAEA